MLDLRPCLIRNLSMDLEIALKITHGQGQVEVTLTAEILRFAQDDDWVAAEMKTNSGSSVGGVFYREIIPHGFFESRDGGDGYSNPSHRKSGARAPHSKWICVAGR